MVKTLLLAFLLIISTLALKQLHEPKFPSRPGGSTYNTNSNTNQNTNTNTNTNQNTQNRNSQNKNNQVYQCSSEINNMCYNGGKSEIT